MAEKVNKSAQCGAFSDQSDATILDRLGKTHQSESRLAQLALLPVFHRNRSVI